MDNFIKFILNDEILSNGIVPLVILLITIIVIIIVTGVLVKNEIKGVNKNEKN